MIPRTAWIVVCVCLAAFLPGCGGAEEPGSDGARPTATTSVDETAPKKSPPPMDEGIPREPVDPSNDPDGFLRGYEKVETPGGGYRYVRVAPRRTVVQPEDSCRESGTGSDLIVRPPAPGLRAVRVDESHVRVDVDARSPEGCSPEAVQLSFDVTGNTLPAASSTIPVGRLRDPLIVPVPERMRDADVVHASSITDSGRTSDSVSVRIVEE